MLMKAMGSQIRHSARVWILVIVQLEELLQYCCRSHNDSYTNVPRIVICFVGNGGVRLRAPVCPAADCMSATSSVKLRWGVVS